MSRIRLLPEHLVNKIAAGEVVERPASVVKELVENALDAEATQITVDLRDAGRQLIRVRDDGIGMTAEELGWALTRHATSKIATDADLDAIQTLGFRGEALPAIAAVSRFSLLSCAKGALEGALMRGAAGVAEPALAVAAPGGTTVEVQDLFFNTPARLKFLKAARTELALVLRLLQSVALAHPELHLAVTHDGRAVLTAPRARSLRERVGALYGWELSAKMLDLRRAEHGLAMVGLIAPPQLARASREEITWVVNGRPVRDTRAQPDAARRLSPDARAGPAPGGGDLDRRAAPGSGRERASRQGVGALPRAPPGAGGSLRGRAGSATGGRGGAASGRHGDGRIGRRRRRGVHPAGGNDADRRRAAGPLPGSAGTLGRGALRRRRGSAPGHVRRRRHR